MSDDDSSRFSSDDLQKISVPPKIWSKWRMPSGKSQSTCTFVKKIVSDRKRSFLEELPPQKIQGVERFLEEMELRVHEKLEGLKLPLPLIHDFEELESYVEDERLTIQKIKSKIQFVTQAMKKEKNLQKK